MDEEEFKILKEIWSNDKSKPKKFIAECRGIKYFVLKDDTPIYYLYKKVLRNKKYRGTLFMVDSKRCIDGGEYYIITDKDRSLHPSNYSKINVNGVPTSIIKSIESLK